MDYLPIYNRDKAERLYDLQTNGIRVEVFTNNDQEMISWCNDHCEYAHGSSEDAILITKECYQYNLDIADKKIKDPRRDPVLASVWIESELFHTLNRELNREMERDVFRKLGLRVPQYYFWFSCPEEAMLFKLTWGG